MYTLYKIDKYGSIFEEAVLQPASRPLAQSHDLGLQQSLIKLNIYPPHSLRADLVLLTDTYM